MTQNGLTLPLATYAGPAMNATSIARNVSAGATTSNGTPFAEIAKLLGNGHHHHPTGAGGATSVLDSSGSSDAADAFGVASSGTSPSVDAFGTASSTPSSTASLVSGISDPFSSIASNFDVQAQLQSQQILDL